jgi:hypothetical protein
MPLGAVACLAWLRRFPRAAAAAAIAFGFALSLTMELLQNYVPGRTTSLSDLATNTIGAAAGALLALAFAPAIIPPLRSQARRASPGALLLLGCWGAYQLYPFFPIFSSTHLREALHALIVTHAFSPVATWAAMAEWFAAALALEAVFGRLRASWLAWAMLVLGLRIFMPSRSLALDEVAGAALALLAWEILPSKRRLRFGVWIALSAILLVELAPFQFHPCTRLRSLGFRSAPRSKTNAGAALVILLRKAFFYGSAVWLLARSGVRTRWPAPRSPSRCSYSKWCSATCPAAHPRSPIPSSPW